MIASGGLSGGISSSIAGGNFWSGVRQGLITSGLNHAAHLASSFSLGPGDPPEKSKKGYTAKASNGLYYGGDGSGSISDWIFRAVFETDQYNPIALVWDGVEGIFTGSDRFGNPLSPVGSTYKIGLAIPIGKVAGVITNGFVGKTVVSGTAKAGTNVVYQGFDKTTNVVKYVGITSREPAIRFAEHAASGTAKAALRYRVIDGAIGLSRTNARVLEQTLINQYGLQKNGGQLLNKINSIAPQNWKQYGLTF